MDNFCTGKNKRKSVKVNKKNESVKTKIHRKCICCLESDSDGAHKSPSLRRDFVYLYIYISNARAVRRLCSSCPLFNLAVSLTSGFGQVHEQGDEYIGLGIAVMDERWIMIKRTLLSGLLFP